MSTLVRRLLGSLMATTLIAMAATAPPSARADSSVVPILNGGELHWSGIATRTYRGSSDDTGISSTDDATSTIGWDTRFLMAGHYVDDPATPVPDTYMLSTDFQQTLGTGSEDQSWSCDPGGDPDCAANIDPPQHCTWAEHSNQPSAFVLDQAVGRHWIVSSGGIAISGTNYSCADRYNLYDPTLWGDCDELSPPQADVCGLDLKLPDAAPEGDAATTSRQFDHASSTVYCQRSDDNMSCTQTGHSAMTFKCALCVTDIKYQEPELPGRTWIDVPASGAFDGNEVRVTATIHNDTKHAITAPVRFRDLTTVRDLPAAAGGQKPDAQVSFPAGADTQVVLDWDTEGFAWYGPHTADPHKIAVLTPYGAARRDMAVRPKPVLLVHGWNAKPATWDGYQDNFTNVRSDWLARAATGMDTDPFTGNAITTNAQILGTDIDHLRTELHAEHVDLVVHSMGGLISRAYLQYDAPDDPDHRPVVSHLVMLGTPNRGSNCGTVTGTLAALIGAGRGWGVPTLQLSPIYVEGFFNRQVTNTRGTKLSVLAGVAPIAYELASVAICGLHTPNDLVVERDSAFWTLTDTGIQDGLVHTSMTQDVQAFTTFVKPHLAVTPDGASTRAVAARVPRRAGTTPTARTAAATAPAASGPNLALAKAVTLPAHGTSRVPLTVASASELGVLLVAPAGVQATLQDPRHKTAAQATSAGELTTLAAKKPRRGRWTVVLTNTTAQAAKLGVGAVLRGDAFTIAPKLKATGKRLTLTVGVHGAGGKATATAAAHSLSGAGKQITVKLRRAGSGFRATLKPLAGGTAVVVTVRGRDGTRDAMAQLG
jgi:pimeloyl-ACP methyl ester carboxylesterase